MNRSIAQHLQRNAGLFLVLLLVSAVIIVASPCPTTAQSVSKRARGGRVSQSLFSFAPWVLGKGPITESKRDIGGFTGVVVGTGMQVFISQGDEFAVRVVCDSSLVELVKTKVVDDGKLEVAMTADKFEYDSLTVYLTMPRLISIETAAGCIVEALTPIHGSHLSTSVGMASRVKFRGGAVQTHVVSMLESGGILEALDLRAEQAKVKMIGFGCTCEVNGDDIDLDAPGMGAVVRYKGTVSQRSIGFGRSVTRIAESTPTPGR
jgi:hypothetical protein